MPYDRHNLLQKLKTILMTGINCVVHYEPYLMTDIT